MAEWSYMTYKNIIEAEFVCRPNRFVAVVNINGREETVHVKNTGRCKELLIPGSLVYLEKSDNPLRKTQYDLVSVLKNGKNLETMLESEVISYIKDKKLYK